MGMRVKEVAELAGVSVRTLHYYDQIGLLAPNETTNSGYRLYSEENLETLQQILFFKRLGFPLKEIKSMITSPLFDRENALDLQRKMLIEERDRIDKMIDTIDRTMKHMRGEIEMSNKEKFAGFNFNDNPYEAEARKIWGDQPVDEANARLKGLSGNGQEELSQKWDEVFSGLAAHLDQAPDSEKVQALIGDWYVFLNENFTNYSLDAFSGLGQLYTSDERFTKNIDKYGEGLAELMSKAMMLYANNRRKAEQ